MIRQVELSRRTVVAQGRRQSPGILVRQQGTEVCKEEENSETQRGDERAEPSRKGSAGAGRRWDFRVLTEH